MPEQRPPERADREPVDESAEVAGSAEPAWQRRRRLAAVFGDVLPETTSDERDPGSTSDATGEDAGDRWLRAQVPPHHG